MSLGESGLYDPRIGDGEPEPDPDPEEDDVGPPAPGEGDDYENPEIGMKC